MKLKIIDLEGKEIGTKEGIDYIRSDRFSEDELLRFFYHYFAEYARNKYNLLSIW